MNDLELKVIEQWLSDMRELRAAHEKRQDYLSALGCTAAMTNMAIAFDKCGFDFTETGLDFD